MRGIGLSMVLRGALTLLVVASIRVSSVHAQDAADDAADQVLGAADWGMSPVEVLEVIKERLREKYLPELEAVTGALEADRVRQRGRDELQRIKSTYLTFEGRVTGWDVSPVGPEFRHGSDESMMYVDGEQYRDYFFFIKGKLWKVFREFERGALGGSDFDSISAAFSARLGEREPQAGVREPGGDPARFTRWEGGRSRFDLIDGGGHLVMVVSAKLVANRLPDLRRNALPRGRKKEHAVVEAILLSDEQQEALRNGESVETALRQ